MALLSPPPTKFWFNSKRLWFLQVWTKEFPAPSVFSLLPHFKYTHFHSAAHNSPYNPRGSGPEVTNPSDRQTVSCILDLSTLSPEIPQYQQYEFSSMCLSYQSPVIFNNFPKIKIESIYLKGMIISIFTSYAQTCIPISRVLTVGSLLVLYLN